MCRPSRPASLAIAPTMLPCGLSPVRGRTSTRRFSKATSPSLPRRRPACTALAFGGFPSTVRGRRRPGLGPVPEHRLAGARANPRWRAGRHRPVDRRHPRLRRPAHAVPSVHRGRVRGRRLASARRTRPVRVGSHRHHRGWRRPSFRRGVAGVGGRHGRAYHCRPFGTRRSSRAAPLGRRSSRSRKRPR